MRGQKEVPSFHNPAMARSSSSSSSKKLDLTSKPASTYRLADEWKSKSSLAAHHLKDLRHDSKAGSNSANKIATAKILREIFMEHKGSLENPNKELTENITRAFQRFARESLARNRDAPSRDYSIRERIMTLQKRTTETHEALAGYKKDVEAVSIEHFAGGSSFGLGEAADTRSLDELTGEIKMLQNREPCKSFLMPTEWPDTDDMKKATQNLLGELDRISQNYSKNDLRLAKINVDASKMPQKGNEAS